MDWIEKELQKLEILKRDGILGEQSYIAKEQFLRQHGKPAQGGVGMLLSDTAPFKVLQLTQGGPAERTRYIQVGDILKAVDGMDMSRVSGDQVAVRGSVAHFSSRTLYQQCNLAAYLAAYLPVRVIMSDMATGQKI
jgi:hypothetical protein